MIRVNGKPLVHEGKLNRRLLPRKQKPLPAATKRLRAIRRGAA